MHRFVKGLSVFFILAILVSCASTDNRAAIEAAPAAEPTPAPVEAPPAPKFVDIQTWKVLGIETSYSDGVLSSIVKYQYDSTGNMLKEEQFNGSKVLQGKKVYTYKTPDQVEIVTFDGKGEVLGKAVRVLSGDRILKETLVNAKNDVQSTEEYVYDAQGQKTRWYVRTASGSQVSSEYVWDQGKLMRISVLDASAAVIKRFERTYDGAGLLVQEDEYDAKAELAGSIAYIREGTVLVREERKTPTGAVLSSVVYTNDASGNPVGMKFLDRNGRVIEGKSQTGQIFTRTVQVQ